MTIHLPSLGPVGVLKKVEPYLMSACHGDIQEIRVGGVRGFPQCEIPWRAYLLSHTYFPALLVVALATSTGNG